VRTKAFLSTPAGAVRSFLIGVEESMTNDSALSDGAGGTASLSTESTPIPSPKHFHLHLVSDASGETLITMAKAAIVQLSGAKANRHMHPLVRNQRQLSTVLHQIESTPGIVLYTLMNPALADALEAKCAGLSLPCVAVLMPVIKAFETYLKMPARAVVAGQHTLDADYFRRIEAMNFTLGHDDSQQSEDLSKADIVLIGASRTSKTPTSIYLANRGYKTANVPLVPNIPPPPGLMDLKGPFVVGLIASPERISEIRRNRMLSLNSTSFDSYVDMDLIKEEMAFTKKLCAQNRWQVFDVTRKSIEETAATIIAIYEERRRQQNNPSSSRP
jgi:[pyruvate, water dikinase]-phosphate phosphotransferase / [pyruvate, water dikinase] kinase